MSVPQATQAGFRSRRIRHAGMPDQPIHVRDQSEKKSNAAFDVMAAAEHQIYLYFFGRRECVERKAKVLAMA